MSQELVYTSAPRGVAPNSSGFCTVAYDGGMSRLLMMKLERLSVYDFHFDLADSRSALNPENYIHTRLSVGGESMSVLSRVAFCGADFSGRTNKIAHHFRLQAHEHLPGGPAWMMAEMTNSGLFSKGWSGPPTASLPAGDLAGAVKGEHAISPFKNWARHGDPGCA